MLIVSLAVFTSCGIPNTSTQGTTSTIDDTKTTTTKKAATTTQATTTTQKPTSIETTVKQTTIETTNSEPTKLDYVLNTNTMKFHEPGCGSAAKISPENREEVFDTRENIIARGFSPCGNCDP